MNDELARIRERIRQNRQTAAAELESAAAARLTTTTRANEPIRAGTRVFDTVTGLEGVVIGGTTERIAVPTPKL